MLRIKKTWGQTGSSIRDQMLQLPGYLHWWNRQKLNLSTRLTEHKRATRNGDVNNHITKQHLQTKHQIDWDCDKCITYSRDSTVNDSPWFISSKTNYERMRTAGTTERRTDGSKRPMNLRVFIANNIKALLKDNLWHCDLIDQSGQINKVQYHQLTWYISLWLWRSLPHGLSKRQSLLTTTVLFRTTFTWTKKAQPTYDHFLSSGFADKSKV